MSAVLVDGRRRLVIESDERISVGPGWNIVVVAGLDLIMVDRRKGVVFIPEDSEVQVYGDPEPPTPPPEWPKAGTVIDASQRGD